VDSRELGWYVLKTKPHKEQYVQLQSRSLGMETYLPLVKIPLRHLRRGQARIEALFPGYVFARLDPHTEQAFWLRRVRDFTCLLSFDGRPARLDNRVVADLRRRENAGGYITWRPKPRLRFREPVEIVDGLFSGHRGLFVRYLESSERICVLLDTLKSQALVELPLSSVNLPASSPGSTARLGG
jgi:transcriptional antiterminator RfaH